MNVWKSILITVGILFVATILSVLVYFIVGALKGYRDEIDIIIVFLVLFSGISFASMKWTNTDASKLQMNQYKSIMCDKTTRQWGILFLWIIAFPWYLITRSNVLSQWHYLKKGIPLGPLNLFQLQELVISEKLGRDDLVWLKGTEKWLRAYDVKALKVLFCATPPPSVPQSNIIPDSSCILSKSPLPIYPPSNPPFVALATTPNTSQATLSLIFGILGMFPFLCILTIPGIILGHISLCKAIEFPQRYGGKRMAKWGMGLSYFSLIIYLVMGIITGILKAQLYNALSDYKVASQNRIGAGRSPNVIALSDYRRGRRAGTLFGSETFVSQESLLSRYKAENPQYESWGPRTLYSTMVKYDPTLPGRVAGGEPAFKTKAELMADLISLNPEAASEESLWGQMLAKQPDLKIWDAAP